MLLLLTDNRIHYAAENCKTTKSIALNDADSSRVIARKKDNEIINDAIEYIGHIILIII